MELFKYYTIDRKYIDINDYTGISVNGWSQSIYYHFSMKEICTYLDDRWHGLSRRWYNNGKLYYYCNTTYGKNYWLIYIWHENGYLHAKHHIINGEPREYYGWDNLGMIPYNIYVVDGKLDGSIRINEEIHKPYLYYRAH